MYVCGVSRGRVRGYDVSKNILDGRKDGWKDGRTDRGKTVYSPPPSGSGGIIKMKD
jgi:hypothetical protein